MSQSDLAAKLGVTAASVSQWLSGKPCPRARVDEIATILGVASAVLLAGPAESEPSAFDSVAWKYRPAPEDGGRDYGNSNVFATPPDIKTLVRETGQNSKDQGRYSRVYVRYTLIELRRGTEEFDAFLDALRFDRLAAHVKAAGETDSRVGKKLKSALSRLAESKKFYLLRVDDFCTTGLHGSEKSTGEHNPFAALIRNNLDSSKDGDTAGGSYGLGKAVLWRCSGLSTVLFSSSVAKGLGHDDHANRLRFIAKSELTWHELGGEESPFAGPGWLGLDTTSAWCQAGDLGSLFLDRQDLPSGVALSERSGTSALIVDFRDLQSDEDLKPEEIIKKLKEESAINFWPAIESGNLSISVEYYVGRSRKSSATVDPRETAARPFVEAYRSYRDGDITPHPELGETAKADVMLTVPATRESAAAVRPKQPSHDSDCTLLVRLATDDDLEQRKYLGCVAIFRGRGMVVQYWSRRNIVVGGRAFHAVLMAGEAAGSDEASLAAEVFLRLSEPPAHDNWLFSDDLSDNYRPGAKSRLHEMWQDVNKKLKPLIRADEDGVHDEPEELKKLLQIGVPTPQPKLARLRPHTTRFDGERWIVEGEIKVLDRRAKIDARLAMSVVPESGARTRLGWDEIALTKKIRGEAVLLDDRQTIRIEPKTSAVRFRAVSEPGPKSLRLGRCLADVNFVAQKSPEEEEAEV